MTKETPAPNYEELVQCMSQGVSSEVRQERQTGSKGKKGKGKQSQPTSNPFGAKGPPPKGKFKDKKGKGRWVPKLPMTRSQYSSQDWR
jgi:hypothetical protein